MRITILAIGSRGDVQPLIALGVGLRRKGHQVRLVAGDEFAGLVRGAGVSFVPLGLTMQSAMQEHTNIFRFAHSLTDHILSTCEGAQEAVIATILGVCACPTAREHDIPFFYSAPAPALCTGEFPDPLFPPLPLGAWYNRLTYRLTQQIVTRSYTYARSLFLEPRPTYLFCYSPQVVPRPADWGDFAHVTGYWFLDQPSDWQPSDELLAFLEAGAPPVCISFGSMLTKQPQAAAQVVIEALNRSGQRGLLVAGWGGLRLNSLPPHVMIVDEAPFDWLFSRVSAVVHHGGAGTTATALRSGLPSVIVPFSLDQPFWGRRLAQLGAGPKPIAFKRLTPGLLAEAITVASSDRDIRSRAATLGERIRAEDGVGNAVRIIEQEVMKQESRK
jgi:UDP:flavonoid glycosyltransferase YjiC (YdhE family)